MRQFFGEWLTPDIGLPYWEYLKQVEEREMAKKKKQSMKRKGRNQRAKPRLILAPTSPVASQAAAEATNPPSVDAIAAKRIFQMTEADFNRAVMDAYDNGLIYSGKQCLAIAGKVRSVNTMRSVMAEFIGKLEAVVAERERKRKLEVAVQKAEYERLRSEQPELPFTSKPLGEAEPLALHESSPARS